MSSSVPPKVSAALCAAEEARCSLEELLQRERLVSNKLHQVETLITYCSFCWPVTKHISTIKVQLISWTS